MKKNWKTWIAGGAALTLLVGVLSLPTLAASGSRIAQLDYANMKVTLNGQAVDLRDAYGNEVEPFTINGTTYLPVASIGKALGLNVSWDNSTKTVILSTASGGQSTGTNSGATNTNTNTGSYIGEAKAKEIALSHAGVSASQATFVRSQFEYDDGRAVYDVDFWSGNKEYDYEIDAATGEILSYDFDAERYTPSTSSGSSGTYISEAQTKQIVEQRAGTTGTYREFKLERDDGRTVYEGELRSGQTEYDFTIDATTGTILEWEVDR